VRALVDTAWLADEIARAESARLRVVDSRWYLDPARRGRDAFRAGHLPGAVFVDLESELSAPGGGRGLPPGRHPWPSEEQVAGVMGRLGIGPGVRVVVYDDAAGSVAARLWYVLRAHGHAEAAVLDGGIGSGSRRAGRSRRPRRPCRPRRSPAVSGPAPW
jgi:thiosulfate/3-mercaptopyruvate sulfurtransferase